MTARTVGPTRFSQRARGFTLIEVLVVLTLLSMVMLGLSSAMRALGQTEEKIDVRLQRTDELRVVSDFLHSVLSRVSARRRSGVLSADEKPFVFLGAPQEMVWVGVMPPRFGAGGRQFFRLNVQNGALALEFTPFESVDVPPDWGQGQTKVLVRDVTAFTLQYQDSQTDPVQWAPQWAPLDHLPSHVWINLSTRSGTWPPLIAPLRPLPASDPSASGAVFGGAR